VQDRHEIVCRQVLVDELLRCPLHTGSPLGRGVEGVQDQDVHAPCEGLFVAGDIRLLRGGG
jgi:hypothetical protein